MTMTQDDLDFMDSMSFTSDMNQPMKSYPEQLKEAKEIAFATGEGLDDNSDKRVHGEAVLLADETGLQGRSNFTDDDLAEIEQQIKYGYLYSKDKQK